MNRASHLSIKQLRILAGLLRDGNLGRLANDMGLTQQAVSANLASLRHIFDDPLFLRTGRGVTPTDLARELGPEVEAILDAMERLVERAPFDPAEARGTVRISAADYAHAVGVMPSLPEIRAKAPFLKLVLTELEVEGIAARMGSGEIDLVLAIPDYVPAHFPRRTLFHEHYVCVTASGSYLEGRRLSRRDLARLPQLIVSPQKPSLTGSADAWFGQEGLERDVIMSVPHFLLLPQMVAATRTVAFLPSRLLPNPHLAVLELEDDTAPPGFELIAAWHPRSEDSPLIRWLVGMLAAGV
ncbi:LysR family transcriptional regulator [Kaistia terrae]|uniref:LysR substrate-binding domain-containing protein n=1 Tax=Kaistia terrae TaxID=537017 RepID=A0ABW0Q2H3_9HYPH|nr:LysR family transcriptional regulator [Kaistia terrae]MCX5578916.1 LysR family transcriptional regulator [Kaistia terrae]